MSSVFGSLWAQAQPQFDDAFGEPIRVEPEAQTRRARVVAGLPDPVAQPFAVTGIFRGQTVVDRASTSPSTSENADFMAQQVTADFAVAQFTDVNMPRKGWNLVLTSRPGAPRYGIVDVRPDKVARVVCSLAFRENSA